MTNPELAPDMPEDFNAWKAERNRILRELDTSKVPGENWNVEMKLTALHKARYECTEIEPELRHESRKWLEERGMKRLGMLEFEPDGRLPE